ncbi:MAG: peptidoglycan DD-metalloendopeptidase family protein [Candidatus Paceibacterota bacterium]
MASKNQILRILLYGFLILFIICCTAFAATPEKLKDSIEQKNLELQEISNQIKETQKELEQTQEEGQTLKKEIGRISSQVNQLNLSIRSSGVMIGKLELEVESLQYDIVDTEERIIINREAIAEVLRQLQQKEGETTLMVFLRNKSLADGIFEIQGLADLNNELSVEIANLRDSKNKLAGALDETDYKKRSTEIESFNLKSKKGIVEDVKEEKQVILSQTKNQEYLYQKQLEELEELQKEISDDIAELEHELRASFDPTLLPLKRPGVLGYPVYDVYITQEYGETSFARRAYKTKFHNGVDFRAPIGTPIVAVDDGKVIAVGNNGRVQYGKYIIIEHNNNLATLYAHLSRQSVNKGYEVKKGEIIGYAGNTGYSFGSHLHFTVYWAPSITFKSFSGAGSVPIGVTINPMDYL